MSSTLLPERSRGSSSGAIRLGLSSTPGVTIPSPRSIWWYQLTFAISARTFSTSWKPLLRFIAFGPLAVVDRRSVRRILPLAREKGPDAIAQSRRDPNPVSSPREGEVLWSSTTHRGLPGRVSEEDAGRSSLDRPP